MAAITDPVADMLTRIRNATMVRHDSVLVPASRMKVAIAKILKEEGFLEGMDVADGERPGQMVLRIRIKYIGERRERRAVLTNLVRVSRPGRRVYTKKQDIPWVLSGIGVAIISTPKGIMTGQRARQLGVGGEILCKVW